MDFNLVQRMCELKAKENQSPGSDWNPDSIPEPKSPDGPAERSLFIAYGCALGMSEEKATAEYERQLKNNGYGKVVDRHGKPY